MLSNVELQELKAGLELLDNALTVFMSQDALKPYATLVHGVITVGEQLVNSLESK